MARSGHGSASRRKRKEDQGRSGVREFGVAQRLQAS